MQKKEIKKHNTKRNQIIFLQILYNYKGFFGEQTKYKNKKTKTHFSNKNKEKKKSKLNNGVSKLTIST